MKRLLGLSCLVATATLGSACSGSLDSKGPYAGRIESAWWIMFWLSTAIFIVVMAILAYALLHRNHPVRINPTRELTLIGIGGFVLPLAVMGLLIGVTINALRTITGPAPPGTLRIDILAADWWWDVRYTDSGVRTANIIHIPVGETVSITGNSRDVVHSFWVSQLNGKMDFIPGKPNEFKIKADKPGTYRGQCGEYCGLSHANMIIYVVAQPKAEFDAWIQQQQQPANLALDARGQQGRQIFFSSSCVACHAINGTSANATVAPDLTHLASREWFAGAAYRLNQQNLSQWVEDPKSLKPGALMPSTQLPPDDLSALVSFLLSLK